MNGKATEISWVSLWRILFFVSFVAILFLGKQVLVGLFLAIVISSGLDVVVNFLEKRGVPRTLGVILIFLIALFLVIIVIYALIPRVIVELNAILSSLKTSTGGVLLSPLIDFPASRSFGSLVKNLSAEFFSGNVSPLGIFSKALGGFGLAIGVLVSSIYLSISKDGVERFLRAVLPTDYEKSGLRIYEHSKKKIGAWFRAQILLSLIMGALVWGSLALLGVKHAFLLGVLAGIFELVPFVGPIISGAVSVIVAFSGSAILALYTLLVFLGLHQLESHVLVPVVIKKAVGLHPVIVIVSLLIGFEVLGFLGIIVAVPAAAVFQEIIDEWSSGKRKGVVEHD